MRTTLTLDPDVVAAAEQIRREQRIGLSEAVNMLVRRGLAAPADRHRYRARTAPLGLRVDVTNIGDVLDVLDSDR